MKSQSLREESASYFFLLTNVSRVRNVYVLIRRFEVEVVVMKVAA
jgi:hypothetical protein